MWGTSPSPIKARLAMNDAIERRGHLHTHTHRTSPAVAQEATQFLFSQQKEESGTEEWLFGGE